MLADVTTFLPSESDKGAGLNCTAPDEAEAAPPLMTLVSCQGRRSPGPPVLNCTGPTEAAAAAPRMTLVSCRGRRPPGPLARMLDHTAPAEAAPTAPRMALMSCRGRRSPGPLAWRVTTDGARLSY